MTSSNDIPNPPMGHLNRVALENHTHGGSQEISFEVTDCKEVTHGNHIQPPPYGSLSHDGEYDQSHAGSQGKKSHAQAWVPFHF